MQKSGQVTFESLDGTYQEIIAVVGKNATMVNLVYNGQVTSYKIESDLLKNGHEVFSDVDKAYIVFNTLEYRLDLTSVIKQVILAVKAKQEK